MATSFDVLEGRRLLEGDTKSVGVSGYQKPDSVLLSEQLIEQYAASRNSWASQARKDDEFRNGVQWTGEEEAELRAREQAPIVVNVIHPAVEQAKAMLTTNKPRFASTGREDSDTRTGRVFADLLTYIWEISDGNTELKRAIDQYYVRGLGTMMAYSDPFADHGKGEIYVKYVDDFDVFVDPNSTDPLLRDAAHIIISRVMSHEQLQRLYPNINLAQATPTTVERHPTETNFAAEAQQIGPQGATDSASKRYEVLDRYSRVRVPHFLTYDRSSGDEWLFTKEQFTQYLQSPAFVRITPGQEPQFIVEPNAVQQAADIFAKTGGVFHYEPDQQGGAQITAGPATPQPGEPDTTVILKQVTVQDAIKAGAVMVSRSLEDRIKRVFSVGGVKGFEGVLPLKDYPIVGLMSSHNANPYPQSDVRKVRGLQQYINKVRSLIIAHASSSTNVKVLIPRGSVNKTELEREWKKAGAAIIEVDMEIGQPIVVGPVPLPGELYRNEVEARKDIEQILGVYALSQGDASSAPATYKGTVAMDEYGQRRIKGRKDDIEAFLNQLARVVVQLIQTTYTERKVIRLLQPNNKPMELVVNQPIYDDATGAIKGRLNNVTVGEYDVMVVSGSMLPSNRWAQYEYYVEMYKLGLIDQMEVLKKTELVDIEGVLNRFGEIAKMKQMLEGLQAENEKLRGDLQTAERESMHDRKRVEVEKFKSGLAGNRAKIDAATTLYGARLNDELKLAKGAADGSVDNTEGERTSVAEPSPSTEESDVIFS